MSDSASPAPERWLPVEGFEQLGDEYGVTFSNVAMVVRRDTWQHIA